jgi:ribonucleotide reductase alpha subunit
VWDNGYNIDKESGYAKGEPYGFFNLPLSQKYGRIKDGPIKNSKIYPTDIDNCEMTNPCAEISLSNYECCNLCELYLNNIESKKELIDCAELLYKTQKAIAALPFIHEETNKIVHKNMRLGLGVTGICQSLDKVEWLDDCYVALRKFDKQWSKERGLHESIKLTTIKPSGTLSLLGGATPGVHPAYSQYYLRTVRMASNDKLVQVCKDLGYHTEFLLNFDGTENHDTVVVYFPCETPQGAVLAKDMDVLKQLDMVKTLQNVWSDNAVSVTAYYNEDELPSLKKWLKENYKENIKSVSFLLRQKHGFKQAPYQEIDKDAYNKAKAKVKPLSDIKITGGDIIQGLECEGGACPIR